MLLSEHIVLTRCEAGSRDMSQELLDSAPASELGSGNEDSQEFTGTPVRVANELLARGSEMVARMARQLATKLPSSVEIDDLLQSGMMGLIEASRSFNASLGASFQTYASFRIRGAMLDEQRKNDWVPRSVRRRFREVSEAARVAEQKAGRAATSRDVAAAMDMPIDKLARLLADTARGHVLSLDEHTEDENPVSLNVADHAASPPEHVSDYEFRRALAATIGRLPRREKIVLRLHYEQEVDMREIGELLGVSESRICQISRQALVRVRASLRDWIHSKLDVTDFSLSAIRPVDLGANDPAENGDGPTMSHVVSGKPQRSVCQSAGRRNSPLESSEQRGDTNPRKPSDR